MAISRAPLLSSVRANVRPKKPVAPVSTAVLPSSENSEPACRFTNNSVHRR